MLTFTGQFVTIEQGAPTLRDIAIQLGRIPRFMGALKVFWPVLAHSLLVARLCPPEAKLYGLLHDAAEVVVGDVPRTIKTAAQKIKEQQVLCRIFERLGVPWPSNEVIAMVKDADDRALRAEAWALGGPDLVQHREFHPRELEAEWQVHDILYEYSECKEYLHSDGRMVQDYIKWIEKLTAEGVTK